MYAVHVVSHTHWDREWYHTAGRFRQRLVALVDELLDEPPAPGESFLLDGQAIVAEDYLAVRPERRAELAALLANGRLEAGPWYVLADELIPGGEALVRNLLAGRRVLRALGADSPPVLYCPDSFGHPAALPELARGFGLELIILWRGYGGSRWPEGDTFRWRSPGGASVLAFHLPPDGYEYGAHLPVDAEAARARWLAMRDELGRRSATRVLLLQNGADHHARQRGLHEALARLAEAALPDDARASSLRAFAGALVDAAAPLALHVVTGELRDSYGYTWTLQGTFGTRAHEKRSNALVERLLVRDAEPWAALARRASGRSRAALTAAAWKPLLQAHPHDTLCGCSIDAVAAAMEARLADARSQAEGIRDDSLADLLGLDADRARSARDEWQPHLVVRNRAARPRRGLALADVREFLADVPVGPASAGAHVASSGTSPLPGIRGAATVQVLERRTAMDRVESPRHYPDNDLVAVSRAVAWVESIPGYGALALPLVEPTVAGSGTLPDTVRAGDRSLENGTLRLTIDDDGVVSLEHLPSGRVFPSLLRFEDLLDFGDLYTPSPRGPAAEARFAGCRMAHRGPLRGEIVARWRLEGERTPRGAHLCADLSLHFVLDAGAPFLRVRVVGQNFGSDHRLRLGFRTDVPGAGAWADAAFGPVRRLPLRLPPEDTVRETPPPTAPLHRYVSLFSSDRGATLYSDGLAEYEARPDGELLVTLVRAVGQLSRDDIPERPGHAGWPTPTPGAQSHGPIEAELAILPHGPRTDAEVERIEQVADDVLLPLDGTTIRWMLGTPAAARGVELEGAGLALSCIKESEDGESTVLRCVNLLDRRTTGRWRVGFPIAEARLARLDETPLEALEVGEDGGVGFEAGAREVITVVVR